MDNIIYRIVLYVWYYYMHMHSTLYRVVSCGCVLICICGALCMFVFIRKMCYALYHGTSVPSWTWNHHVPVMVGTIQCIQGFDGTDTLDPSFWWCPPCRTWWAPSRRWYICSILDMVGTIETMDPGCPYHGTIWSVPWYGHPGSIKCVIVSPAYCFDCFSVVWMGGSLTIGCIFVMDLSVNR